MIKMIAKGNSYRQYSNTTLTRIRRMIKKTEQLRKMTIFKHSENDNNGKDELERKFEN